MIAYVVLAYGYGHGPLARCLDVIEEACSRGLFNQYSLLNIIALGKKESLASNPVLRDYVQRILKFVPFKVAISYSSICSDYFEYLNQFGKSDYYCFLNRLQYSIDLSQSQINKCAAEGVICCVDTSSGLKYKLQISSIIFGITREIPLVFPWQCLEISFGPQSEILRRTLYEQYGIKKNTYESLISRFANAEKSRDFTFVSFPSTLTQSLCKETITASLEKGICIVPPIVERASCNDAITTNNIQLKDNCPGIFYWYVSGTGINKSMFAIAAAASRTVGYRLVANRPVNNDLEIMDLSFLHQEQINKVLFARAGWGIAWKAITGSIPLILCDDHLEDDFEVITNRKYLLDQGLAISATKVLSTNSSNQLKEAFATIIENQQRLCADLTRFFGTVYGQEVVCDNIQKIGFLNEANSRALPKS